MVQSISHARFVSLSVCLLLFLPLALFSSHIRKTYKPGVLDIKMPLGMNDNVSLSELKVTWQLALYTSCAGINFKQPLK